MSTKIEVSDETRAELNSYASRMKRRLGRRVTFDEVIRELLASSEARKTALSEQPRWSRRPRRS